MLEMAEKEKTTPWGMVSASGPLNYNKYLKSDVSLSLSYCSVDGFMAKKKIQYAVWGTFLPPFVTSASWWSLFFKFLFKKKRPLSSAALVLTHFLLFTFLSPTVTVFTPVHLLYTLKERYWSWNHNVKILAPSFLANISPNFQICSLESYSSTLCVSGLLQGNSFLSEEQ